MGIWGVGIDLVSIERISRLVGRWGDRVLVRVFTEFERETCARKTDQNPCLAMRFAAKEAFVKALGLGMRSPVQWLDIQVQNDPLGKPMISLSERAAAYCTRQGVTSWHLSLTDEGGYAAAVLSLET